ncbi:MAG: PAS domain S-box protein [Halanaerobiales bacterium]|nr:PAS domain S-box protein [Halanaerobiales bacterium]
MNSKIELREDLIDKLSIGIVLVSPEREFVFVNNVFQEITGYTEKEINSSTTWYDKVFPNPERRKKVKRIFKSDIENDIRDRTHKITTAAGEHKYLNFRYSELKDGTLLFEVIDISHKIEQKQQLKKQKMIFENLFTNSLAGIVLLDRNLNILEVNKKFEEIFEVAEEELINKNINQVAVPVSSSDRFRQNNDFFLQTRELKEEAAYRVNEQIKYCNLHIFPASDDENGDLIYAAITILLKSKSTNLNWKRSRKDWSWRLRVRI